MVRAVSGWPGFEYGAVSKMLTPVVESRAASVYALKQLCARKN